MDADICMMVTTHSHPSVVDDPTIQTTAFGAMLLPDRCAEQYLEEDVSDIHYYLDELEEARTQTLDDDLIRRQEDLLPVIPPTGGYKLSSLVWESADLDEGFPAIPDLCDFENPRTNDWDPSWSSQLMPTACSGAKLIREAIWARIPPLHRKKLIAMFPHASVSSLGAAWQELTYTYLMDPDRYKPHDVELEVVTEEAKPRPKVTKQRKTNAACSLRCRVVVEDVQCCATYKTYQELYDHMDRHYLGRYLCPGVCDQLWYHSRAELMKHIEDTKECRPYSRQLSEGLDFRVSKVRRWEISPVPLAARSMGDWDRAPARAKRTRPAPRRR